MSEGASVSGIADWLDRSASRFPERVAIEDPAGGSICYRDLAYVSRAIAAELVATHGVQRGDRVGILMGKSVDVLIAFYAVLRCGAAYVPADPRSPVARAAEILSDCEARVIIVDEPFAEELREELDERAAHIALIVVPNSPKPRHAWRIEMVTGAAAPTETVSVDVDDVAFVLYTSGSTGRPKGVMLTHRNVVDFIDWCSVRFMPTQHDRFATHSPLHFSLPVFNVYAACKHGGAVCLIDDRAAKVPELLAPLMERSRATVWFSTPAVLALLAQMSGLEAWNLGALRLLMWAGEALPDARLRSLKARLSHPTYVHILGSTETHMMACYEIPDEIPAHGVGPMPVGTVCTRFRSRLVDDGGEDVAAGVDGELCLSGPGVAAGYWKMPEANARAFFLDANGSRWYRTGDIVRLQQDGNLLYRGRRDRMVKKNGNRVELGEIEACLYANEDLKEVAVVAVRDDELNLKIHAFVVSRTIPHSSIIELKAHCAKSLPLYMVPDTFSFPDLLPRTATGKVDYPRLTDLLTNL